MRLGKLDEHYWIAVYIPVLERLGDLQLALTVSYILTRYKLSKNEWVVIPVRQFQGDLQLTSKQWRRLAKKVHAVPFIQSKRVGSKGTRLSWHVDIEKLDQFVDPEIHPCNVLRPAKKGPYQKLRPAKKGASQLSPLLRKGNNTYNNVAGTLPQVRETSFEWQLATRLGTLLKAKRKVMRQINLDKWCMDLKILSQHYSQEEIKSTWKWYRINFDGKFTPKCNSAKSFVDKFPAIYDACQRDKEEKDQAPETKLGEEIYQQAIKELHWPKGSDSRLRDFIERSLAAVMSYLSKLSRFKAETRAGSITGDAVRWLVSRHGRHVSEVSLLVKKTHNDIKHWKSWSGKLDKFVPTLDSLLEDAREELQRYGLPPKNIKEIIEGVRDAD